MGRRWIVMGLILLLLFSSGVASGSNGRVKGMNNAPISENTTNSSMHPKLMYEDRFLGNGASPSIYYNGARYLEAWINNGSVYLNGKEIMEGEYKYVDVAGNGSGIIVVASGWRIEDKKVTSYVDAWVRGEKYNLVTMENNSNEDMRFAGKASIAVDSEGNYHIAFSVWYYKLIQGPHLLWQWVIEGWNVYYAFYNGVWSEEIVDSRFWTNPPPMWNVTTGQNLSTPPLIPNARPVAIINDHVHIFYADWQRNYSLIYDAENINGEWEKDEIYNISGHIYSLSASRDGENIYLVWNDDSLGPRQIFSASYDGNEWGYYADIAPRMAQCYEPKIIYSPSPERINIMWIENRNGSEYLHYGVREEGFVEEKFEIRADKGDMAISYGLPTFLVERDGKIYEIQMRTTENVVKSAEDYIENLPDSSFVNNANMRKNALIHKYNVVEKLIEKGKYIGARMKLEHDIIKKMDGYFGGSLKDDWIIEYSAQKYLQYFNSELLSETGGISIYNIAVDVDWSNATITCDVAWVEEIDDYEVSSTHLWVYVDGVQYEMNTQDGTHYEIKLENLSGGNHSYYFYAKETLQKNSGGGGINIQSPPMITLIKREPEFGTYKFWIPEQENIYHSVRSGTRGVQIAWHSPHDLPGGVLWGLSPDNLNNYVEGKKKGSPPYPFPIKSMSYPQITFERPYIYYALFDNLTPDTKYYYRILIFDYDGSLKYYTPVDYFITQPMEPMELWGNAYFKDGKIYVQWSTNFDSSNTIIEIYKGNQLVYSVTQSGYGGTAIFSNPNAFTTYSVYIGADGCSWTGSVTTPALFHVEITPMTFGWENNNKVLYHVSYYFVQIIPDPNNDNWDFDVWCKNSSDEYYYNGIYHSSKRVGFPSSIKYTFRKEASEYNTLPDHDPTPQNVNFSQNFKVNESQYHDIKVYGIYPVTGDSQTYEFTNLEPLNRDSDNDSLSDVEERTYYNKYYPGLNWTNPDTDGDHYKDGIEIKYGTDPTDKNSYPISYLLMFYMAADSTFPGSTQSLSYYANQYIAQLKNVKELGGRVRVVAEIDNYSSSSNPNAYRIFINESHTYSMNIGEVNTGDPNTLVNFVNWAVDNNHAIHYALIIWSHGNGWKGVAEDDSNTDYLNMSELHEALSEIDNHMGKKLDVIIFNACLMSNLEVAYEIRNDADIMVASPEQMNARVWPYTNLTKDLLEITKNTIDYNPVEFAKLVVNEYVKEYKSKNINDWLKTIMAFELSYGSGKVRWNYIKRDMQIISKWLYENFSTEVPLTNYTTATVGQLLKWAIYSVIDDNPKNDFVSYYGISSDNKRYPYFYDTNLLLYIRYSIYWKGIPGLNADYMDYLFGNVTSLLQYGYNYHNSPGIKIDKYEYLYCDYNHNHYNHTALYLPYFISVYLIDYNGGNNFSYDSSYNDTQFAKDTMWNELLWKLYNFMAGGG